MIPISDFNPSRRRPIVTYLLIAACLYVYFSIQTQNSAQLSPSQKAASQTVFSLKYAAIPCELIKGKSLSIEEIRDTYLEGNKNSCDEDDRSPAPYPRKQVYLSVLTSMFLHGSVLYLLFNMLFLYIFGNNIEDKFGHFRYLMLYIGGGVAATIAYVAASPSSTVPLVGASGAIAVAMGAYVVIFPAVTVRTLLFVGIPIITNVNARMFLIIWFVTQFFISPDAGVAWIAHVAGFVTGLLVALMYRQFVPDKNAGSERFD